MFRFAAQCTLLVALSAPALALTPQEVFRKVSPSVWAVRALTEGQRESAGSAVVVERERLVTSCQVVADALVIQILREAIVHPARLELADRQRDLCTLRVGGLDSPPVEIAKPAGISIGQRIYAIASPERLSLTLTEGLVAGLRPDDIEIPPIRSTAPVFPGSEGGGLFDAEGRLVGITVRNFRGRDRLPANLGFALPAYWVTEINGRVKPASVAAAAPVPAPVPAPVASPVPAPVPAPAPIAPIAPSAPVKEPAPLAPAPLTPPPALPATPPPAVPVDAASALPSPGATYRYQWVDRQYSKPRQDYVVEVTQIDGWQVSEAYRAGRERLGYAMIDAAVPDFQNRLLDDGQEMLEFAPYLSARGPQAGLNADRGLNYPTDIHGAWTISVERTDAVPLLVPAGTFDTHRVVIRGKRQALASGAYSMAIVSDQFTYTVWYSPLLKRYIKAQHQVVNIFRAPILDQQVELLEYRPN